MLHTNLNSPHRRANLFSAIFILLALASCSSIGGKSNLKDDNSPSALLEKERQIYDDAMEAYNRELYSVALRELKDLRERFPKGHYYQEAVMKTADSYYYSGKFPEAISAYEEFTRLYPKNSGVAWSELQIARCHLNQFRDFKRDNEPLAQSAKAFRKFIKNNPNSEHRPLAIRALMKARENKASYEVSVVEFYLRQRQFVSAARRLASLKHNFPKTKALANLEKNIEELPELESSKLKEMLASKPVKAPEEINFSLQGIGVEQSQIDKLHGELLTPETSKTGNLFSRIKNFSRASLGKNSINQPLLDRVECVENGKDEMFIVYLNSTAFSLSSSKNADLEDSVPEQNGDKYILIKRYSNTEKSNITSQKVEGEERTLESKDRSCSLEKSKLLVQQSRTESEHFLDVGVMVPKAAKLNTKFSSKNDPKRIIITVPHSK